MKHLFDLHAFESCLDTFFCTFTLIILNYYHYVEKRHFKIRGHFHLLHMYPGHLLYPLKAVQNPALRIFFDSRDPMAQSSSRSRQAGGLAGWERGTQGRAGPESAGTEESDQSLSDAEDQSWCADAPPSAVDACDLWQRVSEVWGGGSGVRACDRRLCAALRRRR